MSSDTIKGKTVIKVIGIGGGGGRAIDHMIRSSLRDVEFVAADTDAQALKRGMADGKLYLGESAPGAGPEAGRAAAEASRERIIEALQGAHMVFVVAGMGGGTGAGAAPVVARLARELGALTVAVVTKPFPWEGKCVKTAEAGIAELQKRADSLIVILNDRLPDAPGDDVSMPDAFQAADNALCQAVGGIAGIIRSPDLVNDFEDIRTLMGEMGMAAMGWASASGADRARLAAERAIAFTWCEGFRLSHAKGALIHITASGTLKMREVTDILRIVREAVAENAHILFGIILDERAGDDLRVTVIAAGLDEWAAKSVAPGNLA
jgi:cell division protein FtsZ